MAEAKYKPLSFTTTIRNPERMPSFLNCLLPIEGKKLTSDAIHEVIKNVLRDKIYKPTGIGRNQNLKNIYENDYVVFTDDQLEQIIIDNPQKHKEAGFAYGWDSRFDTWFKIFKEMGFANYEMGKPVEITQTGHMLIEAYTADPVDSIKIQKVYLNALMKYQTSNPLRKILNENAPLPLLLKTIKLLDEDPKENGAGLARHELPILICWGNNDANAVYKYIKNIRKHVGFQASDEYIYEKCLSILESDNRKYFKMDKICHEAVDEYIRKMRMSGLLSLRGNGRFLDINSFEQEAVDYVIEHYMEYPKFSTAEDYIKYMGTIDSCILEISESASEESTDIKKNRIKECAKTMTKDYIFNELRLVSSNRDSKDAVLKFIPGPTRLEFLTSIALKQNFDSLDVCPNYSIDDEGYPTSTALGGMADIECFDSDYDSYYEVTLMKGRSDQINNEIIPISRHLQEAIKERREESFAVFIAPIVHVDTIEACDWQKHKYDIDIIPYNIEEFIQKLTTEKKASGLLNRA